MSAFAMKSNAVPSSPAMGVGPMRPWERVCFERGYHDWQEFIDPDSAGFMKCRDCGKEVDCEGVD
jgi:hypothetical protein